MIELHSIEMERQLLAALIESQWAYDRNYNQLSEALFFFDEHKTIYNAIVRIKKNHPGQGLDILLVKDELHQTNELERIGGDEVLSKILYVPNINGLSMVISSLKEYAVKRNIDNASRTAIEQVLNGDKGVDVANRLLERVGNINLSTQKIPVHKPRDFLLSLAERIKSYEVEGSPIISTGFPELDFTIGMMPGDLAVLAARPSMGKTALAMNIATTIAQTYSHENKSVLFFSLEMTAESVFNRMVAAEGSIDFSIIQGKKRADEAAWGKIFNVTQKVMDLPLQVIDRKGLTLNEIKAEVHRVHRENTKAGKPCFSLIMIDYLQFIGGLSGSDKIDKINDVTKQLKIIGQEYNCPVLLLSQLNRGVESRPDKRPMMSDLRDSGTIEQDADIIMFIYREEYYNEKCESKDKGVAEILVEKNRNGATGTVRLGFEGQYVRFTNHIPMVESDEGGVWK